MDEKGGGGDVGSEVDALETVEITGELGLEEGREDAGVDGDGVECPFAVTGWILVNCVTVLLRERDGVLLPVRRR